MSGLLINLTTLTAWLVFTWAGLFLIYSSAPQSITNDNDVAATFVERLYFTGYVLSTLGLGDYTPVSPPFVVITSVASFYGFVFFTTSMTYLISISSDNLHKRTLALSIYSMGKTPEEIIQYLNRLDNTMRQNALMSAERLIQRHTVDHKIYPLLHYYNNAAPYAALSINVVVLDEALSMLLSKHPSESYCQALLPLRKSMDIYLSQIKNEYGHVTKELPDINWKNLPFNDSKKSINNTDLRERRQILKGLLESENFRWEDVYDRSVNTSQ